MSKHAKPDPVVTAALAVSVFAVTFLIGLFLIARFF